MSMEISLPNIVNTVRKMFWKSSIDHLTSISSKRQRDLLYTVNKDYSPDKKLEELREIQDKKEEELAKKIKQ